MGIDWLTVAAQLANFVVLIWLLKRFLFQPVTEAMARREQRIQDRLADARRVREAAESEAIALEEARRALDEVRETEIAKAREAANELARRLEADLREEAARKRAAWVTHLKEDRAEIVLAMQRRMAGHVRSTVRRILSEFADADLADAIASEFVRHVETLALEDKQRLAMAAGRADEPALLESGMDLPPAARGRITRAIHENIAEDVHVTYQAAEDVLFGIRLTVGHQVLEWSAGRYLDGIATLVDESLDAAAREAVDAA